MHLIKNLAALATLLTLATAAPAPNAASDVAMDPRAAAGTVSVTTYSGDACTGSNSNVVITNGGYRCVAVSNTRSINVSGNCRVTTWSGGNCGGSSFVAPGNGCFSVLYGSVSIQC